MQSAECKYNELGVVAVATYSSIYALQVACVSSTLQEPPMCSQHIQPCSRGLTWPSCWGEWVACAPLGWTRALTVCSRCAECHVTSSVGAVTICPVNCHDCHYTRWHVTIQLCWSSLHQMTSYLPTIVTVIALDDMSASNCSNRHYTK